MTDSRRKGAAAEYKVRDLLRQSTGLDWERVPSSGALHYLKGDLYVPHEKMLYCVEVKSYKEPSINHLLINGKPNLLDWWEQATTQTTKDQAPVLFFKWNRSKLYVMVEGIPEAEPYIFISRVDASILLADDWLATKPEFIE